MEPAPWVAGVRDEGPKVTRIAEGVYRVEHDGRNHVVYVAGPPDHRWAFCNGQVFRGDFRARAPERPRAPHPSPAQSLTAPMPSRVIKVAVEPGAEVKRGETVVVLEAMKMELPVRAPADGVVIAVWCREGELVEADAPLVELR